MLRIKNTSKSLAFSCYHVCNAKISTPFKNTYNMRFLLRWHTLQASKLVNKDVKVICGQIFLLLCFRCSIDVGWVRTHTCAYKDAFIFIRHGRTKHIRPYHHFYPCLRHHHHHRHHLVDTVVKVDSTFFSHKSIAPQS